jgi:hypothetical protein
MQKVKRRLKKRNAIKARIKYHAHPKKWPTGGSLSIRDGHVGHLERFVPIEMAVEALHPMWGEPKADRAKNRQIWDQGMPQY